MTELEQKQQIAIRKYLDGIPWLHPVAVSLTLKQRVDNHQIDVYEATKNFRHFMSRLNRRIFGNSAKRFGRGLRVIPVLEHDELVRFHNHATIDRPDHVELERFKEQIGLCWLKTAWGYNEMCIVPVTNGPGWHRYITKLDQKPEYDLAIDWMNARTR